MNVSIGPRWESFVDAIVAEGRYESADAVMLDGLRLFEERERKLRALRKTVDDAIALGGSHSDADVSDTIDQALEHWELRRRA